MDNLEIKSLKDFFCESIFNFYRIGLQTSGKNFDDVIPGRDGELFWRRKNGATRTFGKKLSQLFKKRK